jgi:hypothetical protein
MAGAAHSGAGGSSYAGTATYHATMTELADGDLMNNTLVYDEGLCNLADRTAWLKARAIDVGALFVTDGAGGITLTSSIGVASASVTATYVSLTLSAALTGFPLIAVSAIGGAAAADWRSVDYLVVGASEIRIYFFKSVMGVLTPMVPNAEIVSGSLLLLEV